jgi:hypothetical protein
LAIDSSGLRCARWGALKMLHALPGDADEIPLGEG